MAPHEVFGSRALNVPRTLDAHVRTWRQPVVRPPLITYLSSSAILATRPSRLLAPSMGEVDLLVPFHDSHCVLGVVDDTSDAPGKIRRISQLKIE